MIRRVCRSTFRAETIGATYGVEFGDFIRATMSELEGKFTFKDWDKQDQMRKHLWLTDCKSLHDYLLNPKQNNSDDKRLEIDLEGLRDPLWFYADGRPKDSVKEQQHDQVRWIDTSTMLCDPLTKYGEKGFEDRLVTAYSTGFMDLEATAESEMRKL